MEGDEKLNYFYSLVLIVVLALTIFRQIHLYNKGKYTPFLFSRSENEIPLLLGFLGVLVVSWSIYKIRPIIISFYIFVVYSVCFIISTSVLNFLSYNKKKQPKIIINSILFNFVIIAVTILLWQRIVK